MNKRNKLHAINKYNKNLFTFGGANWNTLAEADRRTNPWDYTMDGGSTVSQYQNQKNWLGITKKDNPFSKGNINSTMGSIVGSLGGVVNGIISNAITGGFNYGTGTGNAISNIGNTVGGALSAVNPILGAAVQVGTGLIGGLTNRAFGHQENDETKANVKAHNANIDTSGNAVAQASSNEDLLNNAANADGMFDISKSGFKNGWFNNDGDVAYNNMSNTQVNAVNRYAQRLMQGAKSVDSMNDDNIMINFAALGGPIRRRNNEIKYKNKIQETLFNNNPSNGIFAIGGDIQRNGSDFTDGLTTINAGGSHEENPYDGVQVGISQENSQPNLVEEGETIFDDYVYSKRIMIDNETKRKFHISKKKEISYADLSKKLEEESKERPNDPISKKGLEKQMHDLANEQERQKSEMQTKEAQAIFAQLQPEQQATIIQQIAMQNNKQIGEGMIPSQNEQISIFPTENTANVETVTTKDNNNEVTENINATGGNLYPDGGGLENQEWYKDLTDSTKSLIKMLDIKDENSFNNRDVGFWNALENIYNYSKGNTSTINDNNETVDITWGDLPINSLYSNMVGFDEDIYNILQELDISNNTYNSISTEQWKNIESRYLNKANEFKKKYPTIPYSLRYNDGYRKIWDKEYKEEDNTKITPSVNENEKKIEKMNIIKQNNPPDQMHAPKLNLDGLDSVLPEDYNNFIPNKKTTFGRELGLMGPAVGLGMMAAGIGKPDYARMNNAVTMASQAPALAGYQTLGNYMKYTPMDIWSQQNRMNATSRATDRAIMNTNGIAGGKMAGLLASGYNDQLASADLFKKAQEYNDNLYARALAHNTDIDKFNATAFAQNSATNAGIINAARQQAANAAMNAAQQRMAAEAGWYNSLYGNINQFFKGLGNWGKENEQYNMIAAMAADTTNLGDSNVGKLYGKNKKNS